MFHRTPCLSAGAPPKERTCVSDPPNDGPATAATESAATANGNGSAPRRRSAGGLAGKLLPELQQLAGDLGITGTARMRKSELIAAIQERQGGGKARTADADAAAPAQGTRPAQRTRSAQRSSERADTGDEQVPDAQRSRADRPDGQRQRDGQRPREGQETRQRDSRDARQRDGQDQREGQQRQQGQQGGQGGGPAGA